MHIAMYTNSKFTTAEAAQALEISKATLLRWIRCKAIPEPEILMLGRVKYRRFSYDDIQEAKRYKRWLHRPFPKKWTKGAQDEK